MGWAGVFFFTRPNPTSQVGKFSTQPNPSTNPRGSGRVGLGQQIIFKKISSLVKKWAFINLLSVSL